MQSIKKHEHVTSDGHVSNLSTLHLFALNKGINSLILCLRVEFLLAALMHFINVFLKYGISKYISAFDSYA